MGAGHNKIPGIGSSGLDLAALAAALPELYPQLFRIVYRRTGNPTAAEDAVQNALLAAIEKPESYEGGPTLEAMKKWLVRMAINSAIDEYRHSARRPTVALERQDDDQTELDIAAPDDVSRSVEQRTALRSLLRQLPSQQRAVVLAKAAGYPTGQIASTLGISPGYADVQAHRARRQMQTGLEAWNSEDAG